MINREERELVRKCIRQDRLAQRVLYEKYKSAMFSTAYRITNDNNTAHDALQDAFIAVFKDISKFKGKSTIGSWIKTIVVRKAIGQLKSIHLHLDITETKEQSQVVFDENLTGETLDQAIRQLPDRSRAVFNLVEVEGYSHKEVSELLNISVGTSKSQLSYAKQKLRGQLKIYGYEAGNGR